MSIHLAFFDLAETFAALVVIATGASAVVVTLLTVLVHIACAIAVFSDGKKLERRGYDDPASSSDTILVPPEIWAAATLVMGIAMLGGYWVLHHTTFFERRVRPLAGHTPGASAADAASVG